MQAIAAGKDYGREVRAVSGACSGRFQRLHELDARSSKFAFAQ